MAAGNTELCVIINVEPKLQCKACLKHCNAGIVYCTCGHLMTNDSAENRKYTSAVLDTFSVPNFYIRKNRPHGHRYGKSQGCKEYFTANQLAKKCRKKKYDSIQPPASPVAQESRSTLTVSCSKTFTLHRTMSCVTPHVMTPSTGIPSTHVLHPLSEHKPSKIYGNS